MCLKKHVHTIEHNLYTYWPMVEIFDDKGNALKYYAYNPVSPDVLELATDDRARVIHLYG